MSNNTIVIVEDEPDIYDILRYNLERERFEVCGSPDGVLGLKLIQQKLPNLVLLDLMLPGMDGLEICRSLKSDVRTSSIPIIMLTAKGEESDIVLGLGMGADDYVVKPFRPKELIARVKAVLRRNTIKVEEKDVVLRDLLEIDTKKHRISLDGQAIKMTATEFKLIHKLACSPGQVFSREQLLDSVHGIDVVVVDRNIDVHIRSIRKKIGDEFIETIRGVGYRFKDTDIL